MNSIAIIIITVCLLFFISGCLLGSAMVSSKLNELKNRYKKIRTEADQLKEECSWLKKANDEVLADYKNLYTYYNDIRKQCFAQQNLIIQFKRDLKKCQQPAKSNTLDSEKNALQEKISCLQSEVEALQKYRPFYQKYLDGITMENDLRFQIQQLKDQITNLKNIPVQTNRFASEKFPINASIYESENISKMFESLVQLFSSQIFECGCVISDDMGFVVASCCDFSDELAGISVLFQQCERLIERNTIFNNLSRLCFVDTNNMYLTVFPLIVDNLKVYCSGLSKKPFPQESGLNTIVLPINKAQIQRSL